MNNTNTCTTTGARNGAKHRITTIATRTTKSIQAHNKKKATSTNAAGVDTNS